LNTTLCSFLINALRFNSYYAQQTLQREREKERLKKRLKNEGKKIAAKKQKYLDFLALLNDAFYS